MIVYNSLHNLLNNTNYNNNHIMPIIINFSVALYHITSANAGVRVWDSWFTEALILVGKTGCAQCSASPCRSFFCYSSPCISVHVFLSASHALASQSVSSYFPATIPRLVKPMSWVDSILHIQPKGFPWSVSTQ